MRCLSRSQIDKYGIVGKLSQAISILETSILTAKHKLRERPATPAHALQRLNTYLEMVDKQRSLLSDIINHLHSGNVEALQLCQNRQTALADMIKKDAFELAAELSNHTKKPFRKEMC